jgi:hypothetical protein
MVNQTNITITILGNYSIENSSSPDSHLRRKNALPSQVAPMAGFRRRTQFLDAHGIGYMRGF